MSMTFLDLNFDDAHNGIAPNPGQISAMTRLAVSKFGPRVDSVDKLREEQAARGIHERMDAAAPNQGWHLARELEHIYAEVLTEPRPLQNALRLFPIDSSVSPVADKHTIRRVYGAGKAQSFRGRGQNIASVSVSRREETFDVDKIVTSFNYDIFEQMASGQANTGLLTELMRTARDVIDQYMNFQTWYGSPDKKLPGVLNYPWLRKKIITVAFDGSAAADDVIKALHDFVNFAFLSEKQAFKPTVLVVSPRVRAFLFQTRIGPDTAKTIAEQFLDTNAHIERIEEAWELQNDDPNNPIPSDVIPTGLDAMLAYRPDRMGIQNTVTQPFTTLPAQQQGFNFITYAWAGHGGVIMREVGSNILGFVTPPSL